MSDRYAQKKGQLPDSYVKFFETWKGWEGDLGDDYGYVVVWEKKAIEAQWLVYEMAKYLPDHWFPFGSNGGGYMLCFDLRKKSDTSFLIPFVGMSEQEAMQHCASFELIAGKIEQKRRESIRMNRSPDDLLKCQRFEEALQSQNPAAELYELAVSLRDEGVAQAELYEFFLGLLRALEPHDSASRIDAITDTMEVIHGGPWAKGCDLFPKPLES